MLDQSQFIDPATGQPYEYGSPGYNAAILPYLIQQQHASSENAANSRGAFYSGNALQDESVADSNIISQLNNTTAQQAEQEKILKEEQAFTAAQQAAQNQASEDIARKNAVAGGKQAAIGGATNAAGTLAGLYAMSHFGPHSGEFANTVSTQSSLPTPSLSAGPSVGDVTTDATGRVIPGAGEGGFAAPSAWDAGISADMGPMELAGGGLAGLAGYNIGGGDKSHAPAEIGGGLGGLGGYMLGNMLMPGIGGIIGAGAGAGLGRQAGNFFSHLF